MGKNFFLQEKYMCGCGYKRFMAVCTVQCTEYTHGCLKQTCGYADYTMRYIDHKKIIFWVINANPRY